eukprot:gb/GECG01007967.1/.p1 GENE.gb/GECG01007967.1/~~gb/GECG01007967.1/.p1  ORF type:complete len:421 (+),score=48.52 gb/GECG01007967.1/:1-1263(+)
MVCECLCICDSRECGIHEAEEVTMRSVIRGGPRPYYQGLHRTGAPLSTTHVPSYGRLRTENGASGPAMKRRVLSAQYDMKALFLGATVASFGSYCYLAHDESIDSISEEQRIQKFYDQAGAHGSSEHVKSMLHDFASTNIADGKPVAFITSGGTKVPLELNTVRFVDNFSTGTRGSLCAEELLEQGYAVIFLHRKGSKRPFIRELDSWAKDLPLHIHFNGSSNESARAFNMSQRHRTAIENFKRYKEEGRLLEMDFESVTEYLQLLHVGGKVLGQFGSNVMFLLAAAVSDFYVPPQDLTEHKIQSSGGSSKLVLELSPVPKVLLRFKSDWAPRGYLVSFKLETDPELLLDKARKAKAKYRPDVVVANLLPRRYDEVHLVKSEVEDEGVETIRRKRDGSTIEGTFMKRLTEIHRQYIEKNK